MRKTFVVTVAVFLVLLVAAPALACGGLVNPNGTVALTKTTTLAAYADGVEHYVTSFEYAGGGAEFGSIVPLPAIPSKVKRAGDWTLQRLVEEITPPTTALFAAADAGGAEERSAKVIYETKIDALDITILEGGGDEVGIWAEDNGFSLTPDAPEVLDFYAERSPIFMAARFDPSRAAELNQGVGDGTPIHLTIPTPTPWVPLRILSLGLGDDAVVKADVFLLTETAPTMLPRPLVRGQDEGMILEVSEQASPELIAELQSDKGMSWLPDDMWLSYLKIDTPASKLGHDLAIDASGFGEPSPVAAGLVEPRGFANVPSESIDWLPWLVAVSFGALVLYGINRKVGSDW
jgi:hypothetical protein